MRHLLPLVMTAVLVVGCSSTHTSSSSTASPTPTGAAPTATTAPPPRSTPRPTAVPHPDKGFASFVQSLCGNLASGNSSGITGVLMYYQYNTGLRWGMMGDGEGHTDNPSVMSTWLASAHPRCVSFSTGAAGHGAVLTSGWSRPAPWSIVEADVINGGWKINDFTFGSHQQLAQAMQVVAPTLAFHG